MKQGDSRRLRELVNLATGEGEAPRRARLAIEGRRAVTADAAGWTGDGSSTATKQGHRLDIAGTASSPVSPG